MERLPACLLVVCLVINHLPSLYCSETLTSSTTSKQKPQHSQQQQQHPSDFRPASGQQTVSDSDQSNDIVKNSRNKRELVDNGEELDMAKRVRKFVGKRGWEGNLPTISEYPPFGDSVGYFSNDPSGDSEFDNNDDREFLNDLEKRVRSFVGKRSLGDWYTDDNQDSDFDKRSRHFVGKRIRAFIGKRSYGDWYPDGDQDLDLDKRVRKFVGKRARFFLGKRDQESDIRDNLAKRVRKFVGKRTRSFVGKRARSFVGKRNYDIPDLFGEYGPFSTYPDLNSYGNDVDFPKPPGPVSFDDAFQLPADKRTRSFVGKREDPLQELIDAQKRIRAFIGKREDKRIRSFVGKRSEDPLTLDDSSSLDLFSEPSKRPRFFVGKRSGNEAPVKRLRSFVGKRDTGVVKRLRSFVGRR